MSHIFSVLFSCNLSAAFSLRIPDGEPKHKSAACADPKEGAAWPGLVSVEKVTDLCANAY